MSVAEHVGSLLGEFKDWPQSVGPFGARGFPGPDPNELQRLLAAHSNYYLLGAIGPDLFFLLPDFRTKGGMPIGNTLVGVADFVDDLMRWIDEWVLSYWDRYFGPAAENMDETVSRLSGDLNNTISEVMGALSSLVTHAALVLGTSASDWFANFSLGHNEGNDNRAFLWSDMLHYRKTGQFARELWRQADTWDQRGEPDAALWRDRMRAYALGYITHIGTDVTGHPFTNEKSGGPFRTHWQRHKVVENHMDARVYDNEHGNDAAWSELIASALHYRLAFDAGGNAVTRPSLPQRRRSVRYLYELRRRLALGSQLPEPVARMLFDALGGAYRPGSASTSPTESSPTILAGDGRPSVDAIRDTYAFMFRYLQHVMVDGFWHDKPLPPELFPNLDFPVATDPGDRSPDLNDPDLDLLDLLLAIVRAVLFALAVVEWILTLGPGAILDMATFGPRLAAYYLIELPVHYMMSALRRVLVLTGYLSPARGEIEPNLTRLGVGPGDAFIALLESLGDAASGMSDAELAALGERARQVAEATGREAQMVVAELLGGRELDAMVPSEPVDDAAFPRQHEPDEHHHPWRYPQSGVELGQTTAGPFVAGDDAGTLVAADASGDAHVRARYEQARTPDDTERISRTDMDRTHHLGSPVWFSAYLIWQLTRSEGPDGDSSKITDWNLDADRGYAWHCWDWNRFPENGRTFVDSEGNQVAWPCTLPSQFAPAESEPEERHDPARPLAVHYAAQPDPGCGEHDP
jgi:hypothetical protein